ncbi:MAG: hypothetical protein HFJ84_09095 [Clostridiales bacterium]|nr:hypothetical protein [Clostridiales bacterium]
MLKDDVIGKIGTWWILGREQQTFYGQLKEKQGKLCLVSEVVNGDLYGILCQKENFILQGQIESNKVTLRQSNLCPCCLQEVSNEIASYGIAVKFSELFIGNQWIPEMILVKSAYVKYEEMGTWFLQKSYKDHFPFMQDGTLLSFEQHNPLTFSLDGFDLQFDFGLSYRSSEWDYIQYTNLINTVFFPKQSSFHVLCQKVDRFSQLLSLFQGKEVDFSSMILETTTGFNGEYHRNEPTTLSELKEFWLTYPQVAACFDEVLKKWFGLAEQANPILAIFMQALSLDKQNAGDFLTVAQALELFSHYFREKEAEAYAKSTSDLPDDEEVPVERYHKMYDLLRVCQPILGFSEVELWKLANKITTGYDYYLHYDADRRYDALSEGQLEALVTFCQVVLRLLLLREIGVPDLALQEHTRSHIANNQALVYQYLLKKPQITSSKGLKKIY